MVKTPGSKCLGRNAGSVTYSFVTLAGHVSPYGSFPYLEIRYKNSVYRKGFYEMAQL